MGRLTLIAACIGGMPVFTFLVVVWLTGGAPLTPLGPAIDLASAAETAPITPLVATASKITLAPQIVQGLSAEPVIFGIVR